MPIEASGSESSSDTELEEPDERTAAELRALAKAMLRGRRRNDILDAAYNRYVAHDDALPSWFVDDQQRHMQCVFFFHPCPVWERWAPFTTTVSPLCVKLSACHDIVVNV